MKNGTKFLVDRPILWNRLEGVKARGSGEGLPLKRGGRRVDGWTRRRGGRLGYRLTYACGSGVMMKNLVLAMCDG